MAEDPMAQQYVFESSDGVRLAITERALRKSTVLGIRLDSRDPLLLNSRVVSDDIPLINVSQINIHSSALSVLFRWCEEHKTEPNVVQPLHISIDDLVISDFDQRLLDVSHHTFRLLVNAAIELDVWGLMYVLQIALFARMDHAQPVQREQYMEMLNAILRARRRLLTRFD